MTWALVSFNLLLNAAIVLLASIALAFGACALLRIERGRLRAFLLSAPLFKAAWEVARGIPKEAFFWAKLAGARQELGSFQIGFGLEPPLTPVVNFSLGALFRGQTYPQSAADVLAGLLSKRLSPSAPVVLGALLGALVLFGLARCAWDSWRGLCARAAILRRARLLETRELGVRKVRLVESEDWRGVPFAAGLLRPWLCLPARVARVLSLEEREAVIAHELAHLAHHDLLLLSSVQLLSQLLFFVPGARWLVRRVQAECEIAADRRASQHVAPLSLASALVRVAELSRASAAVSALSFVRPGSSLRVRVQALLTPHVLVAPPLPVRLGRYALFMLVLAALARASLLGNS
jgi:Zn-dependent protease with chaperone function